MVKLKLKVNGMTRSFPQNAVLPLEARTFEKKQIFQEEQKTIFAIIKPVLDIFF